MTIEERICIWSLVLLILICIGVGAVPWLGGLVCIAALLSIPVIRSLAG